MTFEKLPPIREIKPLDFSHFPSRFHAAVFRLWETVPAARLAEIVKEERELALLMYDLMSKNQLFGYEVANHYYFNKGMLAEKVLNCDNLLARYTK